MSQVHPQIEGLKAALAASIVSDQSKPFAESLIRQFEQKNRLSDKQWYWVVRLQQPQAAKPEPVKIGSLAHLADMFKKAKAHLKFPKFTVQVGEAQNLYTFSLAGEKSKNPGYIYVKRNGTYIGKVSPAADFSTVRDCTSDDSQNVADFSHDPAGVAAKHGKLTGNCCFCSRKLSDERSTEVGYGKVCADHYGLPWG